MNLVKFPEQSFNHAEEKTCHRIPQNEICIDLLQITDAQKVSKPDCTEAGPSVSYKLVFTIKAC